tara:strand:+ start:735 stop:1280 length:546 start_codon:yes stop_codon:yes gene_type:complete
MHTLIVGRTFSGKSALAKRMGSHIRVSKVEVLAYNPTGEKGYTERDSFGCAAADWETADPQEFIDEVTERVNTSPKKRILIVDEAHTLFAKKEGADYNWLATRGRHYGLSVIAITQKATELNTTFRGQCDTVFLFRCSLTDAKFIADEYGDAQFRECTQLPRGTYMKISALEPTKKGVVFE